MNNSYPSPSTPNPEQYAAVIARQQAARRLMREILVIAANFLNRAERMESLKTPQGDPDGSLERLPSDYRNSAIFHYRLQSVWDEAFTALKRVGDTVTFCNPRNFPVEEEVSLILDKQIVLEQFVEDRLGAMLEGATVNEADQPHAEELRDALESVTAKIAELEEKQNDWPKAPYYPNKWDAGADRMHHDGSYGWPYEDRANPEDNEDGNEDASSLRQDTST